jgi:type VI protein secretion system component VasK
VENQGVDLNPAFLRFYTAAERLSTALFPSGTTQPTLSFTLTEVKTQGVPDAVLNIDNTQLTVAGQPTAFHWAGAPTSKITLISDQSLWTGEWSVFKFGFNGYSTSHSSSGRLEYRFPGEISRVVQFDASGAGAFLLNPTFMSQLRPCVPNVAKP